MGGKQSSSSTPPATDGRTRAYSGSDIPSSSSNTGSNGTHRAAGGGGRAAGPHYHHHHPAAAAGRTPYATGVLPMHPGTSGTAAAAAELVDAASQYSLPGPRTRSVGVGSRAQSSFNIPNSSSAGGGTYSSSQDSDSSTPEEGARERTGAGHGGGPRLLIGSLPSHLSPHLFGGGRVRLSTADVCTVEWQEEKLVQHLFIIGEKTPDMILRHQRGRSHPPRERNHQALLPVTSPLPANPPTSVCVDTATQGVLNIVGVTCFVSTKDGMVGPVHIATGGTCAAAISSHGSPTDIRPTISPQLEMNAQPFQTTRQAIQDDLCSQNKQEDGAGPLYDMRTMSKDLPSPTFTKWKAGRTLTPDSSPNLSPVRIPQVDLLSEDRMTETASGQRSLIQTSERQAIALESIQQTMKDQLKALVEIKEVLCENTAVVCNLASVVHDLAAQKSTEIVSVSPVTQNKPSASTGIAVPANCRSPTPAISLRRCLRTSGAVQEEMPVQAKKRRI